MGRLHFRARDVKGVEGLAAEFGYCLMVHVGDSSYPVHVLFDLMHLRHDCC
jgi:hypothetical protein